MAEREKPQFSEDEDLERAKAFWKANGNPIVAGIVLGLGAILGYNYWQYHQRVQGEEASALFDQVSISSEPGDVWASADELMADYATTSYASLGALYAARTAMEQGDTDKATSYLKWILNESKDEGMNHLARLRLASVFLEAGQADEVVSLLTVEDMSTFEHRYHELIGDAYVKLNDVKKAIESYRLSLDKFPVSSAGRHLIQLKLENVNEA